MTGWRPQFKLSHTFWVTALCACVFGLMVADSDVQEVVAVSLAWIGGSLAVTGIIYARGRHRAFFIGSAVPLAGGMIDSLDVVDEEFVFGMLLLSVLGGVASVVLVWWLTPNSGE